MEFLIKCKCIANISTTTAATTITTTNNNGLDLNSTFQGSQSAFHWAQNTVEKADEHPELFAETW